VVLSILSIGIIKCINEGIDENFRRSGIRLI
jgi:hypothetical protein